MKEEHDKSYHYNHFWDYIPTEERYFFLFLSLQSSCVYSSIYLRTAPNNSVKTIIQMKNTLIIVPSQ